MSPILRDVLSRGMVRHLCQDRITVWRMTLTMDGSGGQTQDWRQVDVFDGRMINKSDSEVVLNDGMKSVADWYLVAPVSVDIQAHDRIRLMGDEYRYFDVVGTDQGQTNLLIQHIGLKEHYA